MSVIQDGCTHRKSQGPVADEASARSGLADGPRRVTPGQPGSAAGVSGAIDGGFGCGAAEGGAGSVTCASV